MNHVLFPVVFCLLILPVIVVPPQIQGNPDEIIPCRNLLMMGNYSDDTRSIPVVSLSASPVPELSDEEETTSPETSVTVPVPAGLLKPERSVGILAVPTPQPTPLGKGWVQVNLQTSIDSPTQMIEDRQRYMASGLFNVHVYHQFAG